MDDLSKAPWDNAFVFKDAEDIVDSWYNFFFWHPWFSHTSKREKSEKCDQPVWFNSEINEAITKRDEVFKKVRISESPADWATFKRAKNEVAI